MIKFTVDGNDYAVRFQHTPFNQNEQSQQERVTEAKLLHGDSVLSVGKSKCVKKDNFSRANGRKRALSRALSKYFPKNVRKPIWKSYFEQIKSPLAEKL